MFVPTDRNLAAETKAALVGLQKACRCASDVQILIEQITLALAEARARLAGDLSVVDPDDDPSILCLATDDGSSELPRWDCQLRVLRLGAQVVKCFRQPSGNQEAVLSAFEEAHWPSRIDDPIPPRDEQDSKHRLNRAIERLNKHQYNHLIRFYGDGTGQAICWEPLGITALKLRRAA